MFRLRACAAFISIAALAFGQETLPPPPKPKFLCKRWPSFYANLRHTESSGIGYDEGYSSLNLFFSRETVHNNLPYLNLRGHIFNDGKWAANAGLGYRFVIEREKKAILGANFFYDYRRSIKHDYNQIGAGLEMFVNWFYIVVNGYLPTGKTTKFRNFTFNQFEGFHLLYNKNVKLSMKGVESKIGGRLFEIKKWALDLEAGPYYFKGKYGKHAFGGQAKLAAKYNDFLEAGIQGSYDGLFHTNIQGVFGIKIPLGRKTKPRYAETKAICRRDSSLTKWLVQEPIRQEIVVLSKQSKTLVAKDPLTSQPYIFYHVNNLFASSGNGTFEFPFNNLLDAETASGPGNIIFVHYGNGSSLGQNTGILLQDNQSLLGSAVPHTIISNPAVITIPALTPNQFPQITNSTAGGAGITLANSNLVEGLNIGAASGNGIEVTNPLRASRIRNNMILDNGPIGGVDAGVKILLASGVQVDGTFEISDNSITASSAGTDGIFIGRDTGTALDGPAGIDVLITNNKIQGNPGEGIHYDRSTSAGGVITWSGEISNNMLIGNGLDGIFFEQVAGLASNTLNFNMTIKNNTFQANSEGMNIFTGGSGRASGRLVIENNVFTDNAASSCLINTGAGGLPDNLVIDVIGNRIINNGGSFEVQLTNGTIDARFIGNQFVRLVPTVGTALILDNNTGAGLGTFNYRAVIRDNEGPLSADNVLQVSE